MWWVIYDAWFATSEKFTNAALTDEPGKFLKEAIRETLILRVFASGSESAKQLLNSCSDIATGRSGALQVRVLMRNEVSNAGRITELNNQIHRWKTDVADALSTTSFKVECAFAFYSTPVMIRGYIFDNRLALLSWYSRCGEGRYRSPATLPFFMLSDESEDAKLMIGSASKIFDCYFELGQVS